MPTMREMTPTEKAEAAGCFVLEELDQTNLNFNVSYTSMVRCVLFAAERTREGMGVKEAGLSAIEAEKNKDPLFKRVMEQAEED